MPHAFHTRLTDAQAAAIDAVATFTDPVTGLLLSVSRQDVVHSILNQWMAQHAAAAPGRTTLAATDEGEPAVREETVQAIADSAGLSDPAVEALTPETPPVPVGDVAPVTSTRVPRKKKPKKKTQPRTRPTSADLDAQVLVQVSELSPCRGADVQKALDMPTSTVYGALKRLVAEGMLTKVGELYQVRDAGLQDA